MESFSAAAPSYNSRTIENVSSVLVTLCDREIYSPLDRLPQLLATAQLVSRSAQALEVDRECLTTALVRHLLRRFR